MQIVEHQASSDKLEMVEKKIETFSFDKNQKISLAIFLLMIYLV